MDRLIFPSVPVRPCHRLVRHSPTLGDRPTGLLPTLISTSVLLSSVAHFLRVWYLYEDVLLQRKTSNDKYDWKIGKLTPFLKHTSETEYRSLPLKKSLEGIQF